MYNSSIDGSPTRLNQIEAANAVQAEALRLHDAGLCVLPTPTSGILKRPDKKHCPGWKQYKNHRPGRHYVRRFFIRPEQGICILAGPVSGGVEVLDFDDHHGGLGDTFERWKASLPPNLLRGLYVGTTPKGGYRVAYRCHTPGPYQESLAWATPDDCIIERLAAGHIVMVPGGHVDAHELGTPYRTLEGDLADLPTLTTAGREELLDAARRLSRCQPEPKERPERQARRPIDLDDGDTPADGRRPGDIYNATADWSEILEPAGWAYSHQHAGVEYWTRPGKAIHEGHSASVGFGGSNNLYVFSPNAAPFEAGQSYSPFAAYAMLRHGGDYSAAAKQLDAEQCEERWGGPPAPGSPADLIRRREVERSRAEVPAAVEVQPAEGIEVEPQGQQAPPVQAEPHTAEKPKPRLFESFADLGDEPLPTYLIDSQIPEGSLSCLYGPSGAGKSFVAVEMSACVATGRAYLGSYPTRRGSVLYLSGEGGPGITLRFKAWCGHHGVERPRNLHLGRVQFDILETGDVQAVLDHIRSDMPEMPALVVIDTLARYFGGGNENDTQDMGRFVRGCDRIREATGAAVLVVHHTGRDAARGERGNSSLRAACDAMLACEEAGSNYGSKITSEKLKDDAPFEPYIVRRLVKDMGVDPRGRKVTTCVLVPQDATRTAFVLTGAKDKEKFDKLWGRFGANKFGITDGAEATGMEKSWASRTFRKWAEKGLLEAHDGDGYRISETVRRVILAGVPDTRFGGVANELLRN